MHPVVENNTAAHDRINIRRIMILVDTNVFMAKRRFQIEQPERFTVPIDSSEQLL